jgi:hypothetical protein
VHGAGLMFAPPPPPPPPDTGGTVPDQSPSTNLAPPPPLILPAPAHVQAPDRAAILRAAAKAMEIISYAVTAASSGGLAGPGHMPAALPFPHTLATFHVPLPPPLLLGQFPPHTSGQPSPLLNMNMNSTATPCGQPPLPVAPPALQAVRPLAPLPVPNTVRVGGRVAQL